MKNYLFKYAQNQIFEGYGWLIAGAPDSFDPAGPLTVTHDIMEHFHDDDGSIQTELEALGASIWIRVEGYYAEYNGYRNNGPSNYVGDLEDLFQTMLTENIILPTPKMFGKPIPKHEHDTEKFISQMVDLGLSEFEEILCDQDMYEAILSQKEVVKMWLRRGYRRAMKTYSRHAKTDVMIVFSEIEREIEAINQKRDDFWGTSLCVEFDKNSLGFRVNLVENEDLHPSQYFKLYGENRLDPYSV